MTQCIKLEPVLVSHEGIVKKIGAMNRLLLCTGGQFLSLSSSAATHNAGAKELRDILMIHTLMARIGQDRNSFTCSSKFPCFGPVVRTFGITLTETYYEL